MLINHLIYCHFRQTSQMLPLPADFSYAATSGRLFTCCLFQQTFHMLPIPADFSYAASSSRLFICCLFQQTFGAATNDRLYLILRLPWHIACSKLLCIATSCACMHLHSCGLDNMDPTNVQDQTKLICIF
jgi:hypothetical protein